jgi:hypothetical protein
MKMTVFWDASCSLVAVLEVLSGSIIREIMALMMKAKKYSFTDYAVI